MASAHDSIVASRPREQWADNLRVAVIAGVIVLHCATAYLVDTAGWYYEERTTSGVWLVLLSGPALIGATFALGPLYRCWPVIVTPQDGPAGEDCGLVAVASGVGAALFARDGAEVCEQLEPANRIATSAQPRRFNHFSGDPRAMSPAP